jgi:hypothetical protein
MYDDYHSQGYVPLAINLWENMETVVKPKARTYAYQFLRDAGPVWTLYNISGQIPLNYVIDTAGVVMYGAVGFDETVIRAYIEYGLPPVGVGERTNDRLVNDVRALPNPAAGPTAVRFTLARSGTVALRVFSASGQPVRTLANRRMGAGATTIAWDLRNDAGQRVADGLYFYELTAGNTVEHVKVSVLR